MSRTRVRGAVVAVMAAVMLLALGVLAPGPRRVDVRWATTTALADRLRAEADLRLDQPRPNGEQTWSYDLLDDSPANVERLVRHRLVDDTGRIDRGRFTLAPEVPELRARVRQAYQRWPLDGISRFWPWPVALLCVIALVCAWPWVVSLSARPHRLILPGILAVSLLLRLWLVMAGGQFYWPDENRYLQSRELVAALVSHDTSVVEALLEEPPHVVFRLLTVVPAAMELLRGEDARIPAFFLSLFSVVNIWLLVRVARQLGAGRGEALLAGAFFAASLSRFYYARHLFPYDAAATLALLSMLVGTRQEPRWPRLMACGALAGGCFLTYAGCWTVGGAACAMCVLDAPAWKDRLRRAGLVAAGLTSCLAAFVAIYLAADVGLIGNVLKFASQVNQGNFAEGWTLPWEYLWQTERWLLVPWLVSIGWCVSQWRSQPLPRVVRAALVGLVFVYVALAVCSAGLHLFVVYGRLARQMVPFLCLLAAAMVSRIWQTRPSALPHPLIAAAGVALAVQAVINFAPPLRQQFPREFERRAEVAALRAGAQSLLPVYTHHIYPVPEVFVTPPGYRVFESARHPLQFLPYQYAGYSPAQRHELRTEDIRMRVLAREPS